MKPTYQEIRDRLRYVKRERDDYDLTKFPDFLLVGPQRTGTTWLFRNLSIHPQVYMPLEKELYYWNNLEYPEYHPASLPPVSQELGWYLKWFDVPEDEARTREAQCQEMFGCSYEPLVRGEASATYAAALHEQMIGEILTFNPGIKIIVFVRDPIERAWSHAKKDLSKVPKRPLDDIREDEWIAYFRRPYVESCGRFPQILDKWQSCVPAENLIVAPFRDVSERPGELLAKICESIGVSSAPEYLSVRAKSAFQTTETAAVPDNLRRFLQDMFGDDIAELQRRQLL